MTARARKKKVFSFKHPRPTLRPFSSSRYLNRLPFEPPSHRSSEASRTRKLLKEKIRHYEGVAADLLERLGSGCAGGDQSPDRKSLHVHVDTPTHCSNYLSASAAPFPSDDITEKVSLANNPGTTMRVNHTYKLARVTSRQTRYLKNRQRRLMLSKVDPSNENWKE